MAPSMRAPALPGGDTTSDSANPRKPVSFRRAHVSGRPGFLPLGNNGRSTAPCPSVRSPRTAYQDHLTTNDLGSEYR